MLQFSAVLALYQNQIISSLRLNVQSMYLEQKYINIIDDFSCHRRGPQSTILFHRRYRKTIYNLLLQHGEILVKNIEMSFSN